MTHREDELTEATCWTGNYKVRLVNPDNVHTTGAVEIYLPGTKQWVALVNGSIDQRAARAVCSSIQYPSVVVVVGVVVVVVGGGGLGDVQIQELTLFLVKKK